MAQNFTALTQPLPTNRTLQSDRHRSTGIIRHRPRDQSQTRGAAPQSRASSRSDHKLVRTAASRERHERPFLAWRVRDWLAERTTTTRRRQERDRSLPPVAPSAPFPLFCVLFSAPVCPDVLATTFLRLSTTVAPPRWCSCSAIAVPSDQSPEIMSCSSNSC
ncbi:hypothetical protein KC19_3G081400 [Ceratodon purpureus]|uniref:Uncharacterized protein n=1 Tax=Ceratodon purpureus TaxID=3225 RepID=A0A8T0IIL0_CERPU|nr:hypothetical protein KC19_3G081400 [Ceratodon purpureus]